MAIYIQATEAISPQDTFAINDFMAQVIQPELPYFTCKTPDYKEYINPKQLRRMSKVVRMGITTAIQTLKNAQIEVPDAIIVGTGLGCLDDTEKFLHQMIENDENLLNPTAFIQSTHNTVSGAIALFVGCKHYNFTFSQQEVSFETALLDAKLLLEQDNKDSVLVGGIDEITEHTYSLIQRAGCVKNNLQDSGYTPGEGSAFFALTQKQNSNSIAKISAISLFSESSEIVTVLQENGLSESDIDIVISGKNGDKTYDKNYEVVEAKLSQAAVITYKQLVGEYQTASSFGLFIASNIISNNRIPACFKAELNSTKTVTNILVHSYSKQHKHSFILVSKC